MMLAIMDDRENQNPNELKKSQSMQAEEIKKLNLSKNSNESSTNSNAASGADVKNKGIKHTTNVDTNKIVAEKHAGSYMLNHI